MSRFKQLSALNVNPLKWLQRNPEDPNASARFVDVIMLVFILLLSLCVASVVYYQGLRTQVTNAENALRVMRERDATLDQQLEDNLRSRKLNEDEMNLPHPEAADRDAQFIGSHADVSWRYAHGDGGKYITYEVELFRNKVLGLPEHACVSKKTEETTRDRDEDFWEGCFEGPIKFIASDARSPATRIPTDLDHHLTSGVYSWRVVPVRVGSAINDAAIDNDDEQNRLSEWSAFSFFTIYSTLMSRIANTHIVRVGTNLEQDTHFSRRDKDGTAVGFDISLIRALIEECVLVQDGLIYYDRKRCDAYVKALEGHYGSEVRGGLKKSCVPRTDTLCVKLIPIGNWGDWQASLKHKSIDLFIGSVTRASGRERSGVVFTDGYLRYETKMYGHAIDVGRQPDKSLVHWLRKDRTVGVIKDSTNEDLLDRLSEDPALTERKLETKLHKRTFASFPALENAMDRGELDGLIIDNTFVTHSDWVPLTGVNSTLAWSKYVTDYIGHQGKEEVAIAVVLDSTSSGDGSLYSALQDALDRKSPLKTEFIPSLCLELWGRGSDELCSKQLGR